MSPQELYREALALLEPTCQRLARRYGLSKEDHEDLLGDLRLKLWEEDCAALQVVKDPKALPGYLRSLATHHVIDTQVRKGGRFRPSAAARKHGPVGIRLDTLLHRDNLPTDQAIRVLRDNEKVDESEARLREIAEVLPEHRRRRMVGDGELDRLPASGTTFRVDRSLRDRVMGERLERLAQAWPQALGQLEAEDRLLLRLRYDEGMKVQAVAKALKLEAKPLYRRYERIQKRMAKFLAEATGIGAGDLVELVEWEGFDLAIEYDGD